MKQIKINKVLLITSLAVVVALLASAPGYPANDLKVPEISSGSGSTENQDDLCSVNAVRRFVMCQISYPEDAVKSGYEGTIELYVRINFEGRVGQILTLQPVTDYVEIEEIVVSAEAPEGIDPVESSRHESLLSESRRVIMALPKCDIQEIYGQTLKFTFKFVLK